MRWRVGTSGFSYREWKSRFYPRELPASQMLRFYAEHFSTVEINQTFYELPKASQVSNWRADVPRGFTFALKAPQRITHFKRLVGTRAQVNQLFRRAEILGSRLGPVLFQLPPNFKKDLPRLKRFLATLPASMRAAFEFRHASWLDEETFAVLRANEVALCIAQDDDFETPVLATARFAYVRLRRTKYTRRELAEWAQAIAGLRVREAFVFFRHEDTGTAPRYARALLDVALSLA